MMPDFGSGGGGSNPPGSIMALYSIKQSQLDAIVEIYNVVGDKPFTPAQIHSAVGGIGNSKCKGSIYHALHRNKCTRVIKIDDTLDSRGWRIRQKTYQLTREAIIYMENRGLIPKKVEHRMRPK